MIPKRLEKGDKIGVIAPSAPIIDDNVEEIKKAKTMIEEMGFKVEFSKNIYSNTNRI